MVICLISRYIGSGIGDAMTQLITRIFLRGLFAILPLTLSIYGVLWFFELVEKGLKPFIFWMKPELREIPGITVAFGCVFIFAVGIFLTAWPIARVYSLIEKQIKKVPLLKTFYSAIQDLMTTFSQDVSQGAKVVQVDLGQVQMIGLLTRESFEDLNLTQLTDKVSVFLPMGYAVGGYTVFVDKSQISPLEMKVDRAMKLSLTAWMKHSEKRIRS
ncbi:MAG: hypothetical protein CL678_03205 [Bdellovibrionaceae bacterium]|nr:hypothetical protein [Pseudobdellovibrionaceae bacterium]|tara:strand:+ start:8899 stop:9543 length:645 start_codon:yes stop_codon:yes gene_type:complete